VQEGNNQQQYVMNTITGAWCNYTGWNANCMEMFNDEPYFGGNGYVAHAYFGAIDDVNNITAIGLQAFNNFNSAGTLKRFTMSRPIFRTDGQPAIFAGVNIDFNTDVPTTSLTYAPSTYAKWDSAIWDAALWGGGLSVTKYWQGVNGVGFCGALRLKISSQTNEVHWASSDYVYEVGAVL
jgi:hypothetical protein